MRFFRDRSASENDTEAQDMTRSAPAAEMAQRAQAQLDDDAEPSAGEASAQRPGPRTRGAPLLKDPPYQDPFAARARLKSYPARGPVKRRIWDLEEPQDQGKAADAPSQATSETSLGRTTPHSAEIEDFLADPDGFAPEEEDMLRSASMASTVSVPLRNSKTARTLRAMSRAHTPGAEAGSEAPTSPAGSAVSREPETPQVAEARAQLARMSEQAAGALSPEAPDPSENAAPRATARTKTRLLGFQSRDLAARDPFARGGEADTTSSAGPRYPVGWIVLVAGPGRGASFTLQSGVSSVGRGDDQVVRLDFGDTSISRQNHASIAFDDEAERFFLGHGGKSNLVRLNGRPVLSTEELANGDEIRIGETTLRFVALCHDGFSWGQNTPSDDETLTGSDGRNPGAPDVAAQ